MTKITPEHLKAQLAERLRNYYLVCGNEPLLLQESQDAICHIANQQGFNERSTFAVDGQTNWTDIFNYSQDLSLFSERKILILHIADNGLNAANSEQLSQLIPQLPADILLIIRSPRLSKAQENSRWFKAMSQGAFVNCMAPESNQLPNWLVQRAKSLNLQLDEQAIQLLCYYYEGNLMALTQALYRLSLLYPDGKLTLPRVEQAVNDAAHFTPYHWLDAILAGKPKRALHVLQQLRTEDTEILILLRTLQKELLTLVHLKRQMATTPLKTLFDQQKIWQNRRNLISQSLQRLTLQQLQQGTRLLTQIEINLKQEFGVTVWSELESLTLLLCGKSLPESFIHD